MNIFKLFHKKSKIVERVREITQPETTVLENKSENLPPFNLFIDDEAPQLNEVVEQQNMIILFLNRNYHSMGTNDGYEYHSHDTLDKGLKKIKAEFQRIVDQSIQEKLQSRLQMKNLIVDVTKISDDTRLKLENTVEELNTSLALLQKQKELSAENEGWVMNAIHNYHQGFVQGLNDFIAGENFLNSIKSI